MLLDALGTLVALEPPAPRLRARLAAEGVQVDEATAGRAFAAEIAFYRRNLHLGRDHASLAVLRRRCAQAMAAELPEAARGLSVPVLVRVMLDALEFTPFPDAVPALEELRRRGLRVVVVSNWDCSLHEMLATTGLRPHVAGAVASAQLGTAKPDGAPFRHALAMAGVTAASAMHVGDSVEADVEGARRAGITPVLIDRDAEGPVPPATPVIRSLAELPGLVG